MKIEFQQHIRKNFTELSDHPVLIAVSGGIDSVVLIYLCQAAGVDFAIAHCNFHLRGEDSNLDQQFVEDLALQFDKKCHVVEFDTANYVKEHKVSIQLAARELRYKWFDQLMQQYGYTYLLTAHHLDDSMETFLINFSRGTGLEGLLGIPERTAKIIRPLLPFSREEIQNYAIENDIAWREDITNGQTKYLRNKIRKLVLPIFKEINPHVGNSFTEMISYLKGSFALSQDAAQLQYEKVVTESNGDLYFNIKLIQQLSDPKAYLYQWLGAYGFTAWDDIVDLLDASAGKMVLSETHILLKDRTDLILRQHVNNTKVEQEVYYLADGASICSPLELSMALVDAVEDEASNSCIYLDKDKLTFPLEIRKSRTGDSFKPLGMTGTKKISKFFKDEKFSQFKKEDTWLLCSNDKVVWVIGNRMDENFKVCKTTINIIKLQIN